MKRLLCGILFFIGLCSIVNGKEMVKYFLDFSGYDYPMRLKGEISENKAKSLPSYLKGYYSETGVLIKVENYTLDRNKKRSVMTMETYEYHDNGKIKTMKRFKNGTILIKTEHFDRDGDYIKE
jgi:hypothetical protein